MSNSKEVASLKKELEALQKEIDGSKTPASQASFPASEPGDDESVSLGPSAVDSPEFGPGGTGASGALANAAIPAKEQPMKASVATKAREEGTPDTVKEATGTSTKGEEEPTIAMKRDQSIPSLKLDDVDTEGSQQGSTDAMSDSSAVVVEAEDGSPSDSDK